MIKGFFLKTGKPLSELVLQATRELGKCYSRLEFASSKLDRRNKELFDACSFYLRKGSKARASIYANEVAEIRKVLSILQRTQLSVERAVLRLDTLKAVSPTFDSLKEVFIDVKNALGLVSNIMPYITPEMDKLNRSISEILEDAQFNLTPPEPLVVKDPTTEAILQEAAIYVEQELQARIPEPPAEVSIPKRVKPARPMIALAADGSEVFLSGDNQIIDEYGSSAALEVCVDLLSEELVMDYIERNDREMNVAKCARELNVPPAKVFQVLESLSRKGKIKIEQ